MHAGAGPGQNLSCLHNSHSGSWVPNYCSPVTWARWSCWPCEHKAWEAPGPIAGMPTAEVGRRAATTTVHFVNPHKGWKVTQQSALTGEQLQGRILRGSSPRKGVLIPPACICKSLQSCPTLGDPMDYGPSGSSSMGFSRQEYWSGLSCPSSRDLPKPRIKPASLLSPAVAGRFFTTSTTWESFQTCLPCSEDKKCSSDRSGDFCSNNRE